MIFYCSDKVPDNSSNCRQSTYGASVSTLQRVEFRRSCQLWTEHLRRTCPSMTERHRAHAWKKMTPLRARVGFAKNPQKTLISSQKQINITVRMKIMDFALTSKRFEKWWIVALAITRRSFPLFSPTRNGRNFYDYLLFIAILVFLLFLFN